MHRLLFLLLLASAASAQTFERFGVRDGLPSELITDVELGPDGLLWIATESGLARYDGHGFRVWRHRTGDPTSIPSSRVSAVQPLEDAVVIGTDAGVAWLNLQTGLATAIEGLPLDIVQDIVADPLGYIWIGYTRRGLWRYTPATGRVRPARLGPSQQVRVLALALYESEVWVEGNFGSGGEASLCRLDAERVACAETRPAEPWRLFEDAGRAVLVYKDPVRGEAWIDWLDADERWELPVDSPLQTTFRTVVRVGPREAWFRAAAHLVVVGADGAVETLEAAPSRRGGLGGYDARSFARDRQGNVWVGTEAGLYLARLPAAAFTSYRPDPDNPASLSDGRVNGMAQDDEGRLWVATNGGLNRIDVVTGRVERLATTSPEVSPRHPNARAIWQVLPRGGDRALVGFKQGGVALWDGARLQSMPGLAAGGPRDLFETPDGALWVASMAGLWRLSPDGERERIPLPLASNIPVNVVAAGPGGGLWVGTDAGLFRERDGAWMPVADGSLCGPIVWSMASSPADVGAMWVATVGGGLARVDLETERVTCVTVQDGLPTNSVYGVLADGDGMLWASTTSGLARVDPETRGVATFSSADGLTGDAFNLMAQARLRDGRLAFGGPDGLTMVSPKAVAQRSAPNVVVTGVERQGRLMRGTPAVGLQLAHDAGAFGVRFAATDFRAPRRNRYRYRLVGLDDDWQRTDGSAPRAAYVGVPAGRYRFEVQGAAADTPFSAATGLDVVVVPAVWQRLWFRLSVGALLILALAGAGLGVARGRRREAERERADALEIRRRLAEGRERERARLARDLHDGPIQTLYRVGHDLDRLGARAAADDSLGGHVAPVRGLVSDVSRELRQTLVELRPTLVEHLGLGPTLRVVGRRAEERFADLEITVEDRSTAEPSHAATLALFRIAQEALQNAGRHAGPARVQVRLDDHEGGVRLTVRDDGRGFAVPDRMVSLARMKHFGLVGAQERAEGVGGTFAVESSPGLGTRVQAWVPADSDSEMDPGAHPDDEAAV